MVLRRRIHSLRTTDEARDIHGGWRERSKTLKVNVCRSRLDAVLLDIHDGVPSSSQAVSPHLLTTDRSRTSLTYTGPSAPLQCNEKNASTDLASTALCKTFCLSLGCSGCSTRATDHWRTPDGRCSVVVAVSRTLPSCSSSGMRRSCSEERECVSPGRSCCRSVIGEARAWSSTARGTERARGRESVRLWRAIRERWRKRRLCGGRQTREEHDNKNSGEVESW